MFDWHVKSVFVFPSPVFLLITSEVCILVSYRGIVFDGRDSKHQFQGISFHCSIRTSLRPSKEAESADFWGGQDSGMVVKAGIFVVHAAKTMNVNKDKQVEI